MKAPAWASRTLSIAAAVAVSGALVAGGFEGYRYLSARPVRNVDDVLTLGDLDADVREGGHDRRRLALVAPEHHEHEDERVVDLSLVRQPRRLPVCILATVEEHERGELLVPGDGAVEVTGGERDVRPPRRARPAPGQRPTSG